LGVVVVGGGDADNKDEFEMQADAILPGQTVVIVDDIIATGAQRLRSILIQAENLTRTFLL